MAVAGIEPGKLDERSIGFALAPRLNAAGRLDPADAGLELILTEDPGRAAQIAHEPDAHQRERRQIERRIRFEAEAQMAELGERDAYVLSGETWHAGVIGIVASRLVEAQRAALVMLALDGELAKGSGRRSRLRSAGGPAGLRRASDRATAVTVRRRGWSSAVSTSSPSPGAGAHADGAPRGREATIRRARRRRAWAAAELSMELAQELRVLAPFGRANPPVSPDAGRRQPARSQARWAKGATCASRSPRAAPGPGRSASARAGGCRSRRACRCQATFALEVNEWNGVSEPRLLLRRAQELEPVLETVSGAQETPAPAELVLF